jgi:hypothetical protein
LSSKIATSPAWKIPIRTRIVAAKVMSPTTHPETCGVSSAAAATGVAWPGALGQLDSRRRSRLGGAAHDQADQGQDFALTGGRIARVGFDLADDASIDVERHLAAAIARD